MVMMSSTTSTRAPGGIADPRRSLKTPSSRSTKIALGAEPARGLVAGNDAAERGRGRRCQSLQTLGGLSRPARGTRRSVRAGSWTTNIFCRNTGECSP